MEDKLSALTKQYKQHFGDELKTKRKVKEQEKNCIEEKIEHYQRN